ncbi:MAG: hypothetical protein ACFFB5_15235 [Promethearchaeota archaeon]
MPDPNRNISDFEFIGTRFKKDSLFPPKAPRFLQITIGVYLTIALGFIYVIVKMLINSASWTVTRQIIDNINDFYNFIFLVIAINNYILFYITLVEPFNLNGRIYQNSSPELRYKRRGLAIIISSLISVSIIILIFFIMYINPNRIWLQNPALLLFSTCLFVIIFVIFIAFPFYFISNRKIDFIEGYLMELEISKE